MVPIEIFTWGQTPKKVVKGRKIQLKKVVQVENDKILRIYCPVRRA